MKKLLVVMAAAAMALGVFAADNSDAKIGVSKDAWVSYGDVKFNEDGSIAMSVSPDQNSYNQKHPYTFIQLTKAFSVKPGDVFVVSFKAKGSGGVYRIAGMGNHSATGKTKAFRHDDKYFKVDAEEFKDFELELVIKDQKMFGAVVEKTSPAIMITGQDSKLLIKDLKIILEKDE